MLLDPFEEQFHVPTFAVEFCYGQGFITKMVGQETVDVAGGEVFISDHPQFFGITLGGLVGGELDNLINYDAGVLVDGIGFDDIILHIILGPCNEERSVLMYPVEETEEVNISLIHHINGTHFYTEFIQYPNIVDGSICEIDECGDVAAQIEKRKKKKKAHRHTYVISECAKVINYEKEPDVVESHRGTIVYHIHNLNVYLTAEVVTQLNVNPQKVVNLIQD